MYAMTQDFWSNFCYVDNRVLQNCHNMKHIARNANLNNA